MKRKYLYRALLFLVLLFPLWMFFAWLFAEKQQLRVTAIDKTVLTKKGQEHVSLFWVLNHQKFVKANGSLYQNAKDYYGFFPKPQEAYEIRGLEKLSPTQLDSLADSSDLGWITDAYGIYNNEWFSQGNVAGRSGMIYGGMSSQDLYFLKRLKSQGKLVLAEFNCLGSPTDTAIRKDFESTFGIRWTGWIGRYFDVLDTAVNTELPRWLVRNYIRQHGSWPFKKSGIAFVKEDDRVEILENETHLQKELPEIFFSQQAMKKYDLPASAKYSFWFDIVTTDTINQVHANFRLQVNPRGASVLKTAGIPSSFPVVLSYSGPDYRFWYFACDFNDNPISTSSSYFKGIHWFRRMFYNTADPADRGRFFWNVYRPLVTKILEDYHSGLPAAR